MTSRNQRQVSNYKRKFIPESSNWSDDAYYGSLKELREYEFKNRKEPVLILPIDDEATGDSVPFFVRDQKVHLGGPTQPPTVVTSENTANLIASNRNSKQKALISDLVEKASSMPAPVDEDSDDELSRGSDGEADNDHRYQIRTHEFPSRTAKAWYAACPDISGLAPILAPVKSAPINFDSMESEEYYRRAKNIQRLLKRVSRLEEEGCRAVLSLLNWNEARLKQREVVNHKKRLSKAPTANNFLTDIVHYLGRIGKTMKSAELQRIDEAIYVRYVGLDSQVSIRETRQVTGRAVEATNSLDPTKSGVEYYNPIFVFKNMTVDQLKAVAEAVGIPCSKRKVALMEKLIQGWIYGQGLYRKKIFEEVERVFNFVKILAPVTPEQRMVTSQVLYRVKGANGKVSNHLTFKVLMTTLRKDLNVYLLCTALPNQRMKPIVPRNDTSLLSKQLTDSVTQIDPVMYVERPLMYPDRFQLYINVDEVDCFELKDNTYIPLPLKNKCQQSGWNIFHMTFSLEGQDDAWQTGMLVELIYGKEVMREGIPKYSLC